MITCPHCNKEIKCLKCYGNGYIKVLHRRENKPIPGKALPAACTTVENVPCPACNPRPDPKNILIGPAILAVVLVVSTVLLLVKYLT